MRSEDDILRESSAESLEKRLQVLIKKVERIEKFLREKGVKNRQETAHGIAIERMEIKIRDDFLWNYPELIRNNPNK